MTARILIGEVREQLRLLPPDSVDCVITSPPYYHLRSYLADDDPDKHLEIGLEKTLGEHLTVLVEVFREVRRVMKPKAALWLNYGDCYATTVNGRSAADTKAAGNDDRTFRDKPMSTIGGVFKPKDLLLAPFRLAIALQEDGWWVRSRCMWGKPNTMPDSSGRWRPAVAHEEIFLLSKSGDLFYDSEAVKKPIAESSKARYAQNIDDQVGSTRANAGRKTNGNMKAVGGPRTIDKQRGHARPHTGFNDRWDGMSKAEQQENGRLLRTYEPEVWHMATQAFSDAHFATFPVALVERCLTASCPKGGTVLDPFGGSGTVGLVAEGMGFDSILIELNPEYAAIADNRIRGALGRVSSKPLTRKDEAPLFASLPA